MSKLKNPLISLDARGTLSKALTFVKRRGQNLAESTPEPFDAQTAYQLSWRHMFLKAVALWNALSAAEQQEWESLARSRHMTGYAWFISQALKPNPGLYLPLQGGTMSGDIDMAKNRVLKLPLPSDSQEPLTLAYFTANIAPYLYNEGARVYKSALQTIPNATFTPIAFDVERYDTDTIHDRVVNNSRLTCKTAGKYIIVAHFTWAANPAGTRYHDIRLNGVTRIYWGSDPYIVNASIYPLAVTIYQLAVGNWVEVRAYQNTGAPLNINASAQYSPEFMMQRIGS